MMDILIVSNFCGDFRPKDNTRFYYIARLLADGGHNVELITSDFYHAEKKHRTPFTDVGAVKVTLLHEPGYPKNICLRRFYSHFVWGRNVEKYLKQRKKPDVVYSAVPSLTGPLAAAEYCEKHGVRFVIDVQDLWPEAFQMIVNIPVISDIVFAPFRWIANRIYRRSDAVCAVSRTYVDRALSVNKKCAEGNCVFLGTRLEDFDAHVKNNPVTDKPADELWLGYCGTLGASYDLTCVFDALGLLQKQGVKVPKFIIMGDGPRKKEFEEYANARGVDVLLTGWIPYDKMCGMLCACDIVVNPIVGSSAASIINKHADYAACGLPVLSTQECREYRDLVEEYQMGFNCVCGDAADLADKLAELLADPVMRREMGANARRCAEERFDRKHSYLKLVDAIVSGTSGQGSL